MCLQVSLFIFQEIAAVRSMAMASVIDSEATFEQQASEAGLSQPWHNGQVELCHNDSRHHPY